MRKAPMMILMLIIIITAGSFVWQGIDMHEQVPIHENEFHQIQQQYYSQSKYTRDNARKDSELNDQLVKIQQYPSFLLQLKLVGIGRILTGIAVLLLGILVALISMPRRLNDVIQGEGKKKRK